MHSSATEQVHLSVRRAYAFVGGVVGVAVATGVAATVLIHSILVVAVIWGFVAANLLVGWPLVRAIRPGASADQNLSRHDGAD
jgi:hypothetical protein